MIDFKSSSSVPGDKNDLVWRMCCLDPDKRARFSSVVYELEYLALSKSYDKYQPEYEPVSTFDNYKSGSMRELWTGIEKYIDRSNDRQYCQAFDELKQVYELLQSSTYPPTMLERFHSLLSEFDITIQMTSEQVQILQLSSARASSNTFFSFHWRIQSLLIALGQSPVASEEGTLRWEQQRSEQFEDFVSGVSDTFLLLDRLKSPEERSVLLRTLKREMDAETKYTPDQLETMKTTYDTIVSQIGTDDLLSLTPEWFIPWYELVIDECSELGKGGFGSVCRGKWLDSDVVVKQVFLIGDNKGSPDFSYHSLSASIGEPTTQTNDAKRTEVLAMFRHEVEI